MASTTSTVAVLKTTPDRVLADYARLMELAGIRSALNPEATTILKDNISWHYPFPSANTTPWQLEGAILALREAGFSDLVCVQNKTVVINAFKGEDLNLYVPIFKAYGIPVLYNFKRSDMQWVDFKPSAPLAVLDRIFPEGIKVPDFFLGKNIVHLPTVKCHIYTTTTGAMKNAFGGLLNTYRHYTHTWIHETLVDLLTIQKELHPGIFAVMDGTTAGNGPGPRTMRPVVKNVILASADQVAIDAVAARLMGFDPLSIGYIRLAHERGLGCGDPADIRVVGDDITGESWGFAVGHSVHRLLGWLSWYGPTRCLQKLIFRTPLVAIPILVSEANHDYLHWPLKEKRIYQEWERSTPWGALFQRYRSEGHLGR
ncbi:DUF362 domain-containing protein [Candidatus Fermentibacteria bacterium]|nr:DUF362 domain-containing protein [Candidatus Fermentibacteria bacterium]